MRPRSIFVALMVPSAIVAGCIPHPAVSRFRGDFACTTGQATDLGQGAYLVEGCGIRASYVCQEQEGGTTICVRESRTRAAVRHPPDDGPRPVVEARLSLDTSADGSVRLRIVADGSPRLVYDPAAASASVIVTSDADPCDGAALRGGSGAALRGTPRDGDEEGFTWPLTELARFASEDSLTLGICGIDVVLRGTEMQSFRGFVARAGELRPPGGAPAPEPDPADDEASDDDEDDEDDEDEATEHEATEDEAPAPDAAQEP